MTCTPSAGTWTASPRGSQGTHSFLLFDSLDAVGKLGPASLPRGLRPMQVPARPVHAASPIA